MVSQKKKKKTFIHIHIKIPKFHVYVTISLVSFSNDEAEVVNVI